MESILNTFLWGHSFHKLYWRALKCPVHLGGTRLSPVLYYIASQLSRVFLLQSGRQGQVFYPCMLLGLLPSSPLLPSFTLQYPWPASCGQQESFDIPSLYNLAAGYVNHQGPHIPYPHAVVGQPAPARVVDYKPWFARGVIFLSQVIANGSVKTFQALKDGFGVPKHMFFCYLQLRHALNRYIWWRWALARIPRN